MRRHVGAVTLLAGLLVVGTVPAAAQALTAELRAGGAVGNYSESGAGLELVPGPSFGAQVELEVVEDVSAYAAFNRSTFGCEEGFCTDLDVSMTSQGFTLGARWSPWLAWVRAGLALEGLDVETEGEGTTSSDPGLGLDLGAGLSLDLGRRMELRPGVAYRRHAASDATGDGHVAVVTGELGFAVRFGDRR